MQFTKYQFLCGRIVDQRIKSSLDLVLIRKDLPHYITKSQSLYFTPSILDMLSTFLSLFCYHLGKDLVFLLCNIQRFMISRIHFFHHTYSIEGLRRHFQELVYITHPLNQFEISKASRQDSQLSNCDDEIILRSLYMSQYHMFNSQIASLCTSPPFMRPT